MDVGFWAVVPPLLTIILAIVTKEVLLALFIGVYVGCLIITDWNIVGAMERMVEIIIGRLSDPWNIQVLIIVVMLGGLIGLMVRSGGSTAFGNLISQKIKTRRGAQRASWLIGILIFFDDYFNCLTNGAIMRPITDKFKVSREKLSYIIDTSAVGICSVVPLSSWIAFICSLIAESFTKAGIEQDAYIAFIKCIPYNFFSWMALLMVLLVATLGLDYGPMAKAERRARETGELCEKTFSGGEADEDDFSAIEQAAGKPIDLIAPIVLLVICAAVFMLFTGGFFTNFDLLDAVNNMDGVLALIYAVSLSVVFAIIFYAIRRLSNVSESLSAFVVGTKSMLFVVILLAFAWGIGGVSDELDTAGYMVNVFVGNVPAFVTPLILFLISVAMSFATGASFGTFAIMIPFAAPIAMAVDANIYACIMAIIGGGGCGINCSPLADTAILSSAASNVRLTDHIKTQAPYALTIGGVACFGFLLVGLLDKGPWIPMAGCLALLAVVVFVLKKFVVAKDSMAATVAVIEEPDEESAETVDV